MRKKNLQLQKAGNLTLKIVGIRWGVSAFDAFQCRQPPTFLKIIFGCFEKRFPCGPGVRCQHLHRLFFRSLFTRYIFGVRQILDLPKFRFVFFFFFNKRPIPYPLCKNETFPPSLCFFYYFQPDVVESLNIF